MYAPFELQVMVNIYIYIHTYTVYIYRKCKHCTIFTFHKHKFGH